MDLTYGLTYKSQSTITIFSNFDPSYDPIIGRFSCTKALIRFVILYHYQCQVKCPSCSNYDTLTKPNDDDGDR